MSKCLKCHAELFFDILRMYSVDEEWVHHSGEEIVCPKCKTKMLFDFNLSIDIDITEIVNPEEPTSDGVNMFSNYGFNENQINLFN